MPVLLSRLGAACRNWRRFPPLTPAVGGITLIVIALTAHFYASYIRWLEYDLRRNWRAEAPVDFNAPGPFQMSFRPIVSRAHQVKLTLRIPLEGDLVAYAGKEQVLPAKVSRWFLAGRETELSWQIAHKGTTVASNTIQPSEFDMVARRDHASCICVQETPQLDAGQDYTFTAQVERPSPAISHLSPVLQVQTWGSLKGRRLVGWRPRHTLTFCAVGGVFLLMAYVRWTCDKRLAPRQTVQEQLP